VLHNGAYVSCLDPVDFRALTVFDLYKDRNAYFVWNGDPTQPNAVSRLRYHQMYVPRAVERILKTAPPGADVTSWRY
jgi:hypothetical protein